MVSTVTAPLRPESSEPPEQSEIKATPRTSFSTSGGGGRVRPSCGDVAGQPLAAARSHLC